jgi:hypothetical protein
MKTKYFAKITLAAVLLHLGASGTSWADPKIVVLDPRGITRDVEVILQKIGKQEEKRWEARDIKYTGGQANVSIPNEYVFNRVFRIKIIPKARYHYEGPPAKDPYLTCKLPAKQITLEKNTELYIFVKQDWSSCEVRNGR